MFAMFLLCVWYVFGMCLVCFWYVSYEETELGPTADDHDDTAVAAAAHDGDDNWRAWWPDICSLLGDGGWAKRRAVY